MPTTKLQQASVLASTLELCEQLIARESLTPNDAGCQVLLRNRLETLGFQCQSLVFGETTNLWATTQGQGPLLAFAGHTDVVPTGPADLWRSPPFVPTIYEGFLFGRGSADMKGGLAAMITAAERFIQSGLTLDGRLGFLITSDEEGPAIDGTRAVLEHIYEQGERIDWCVIGEPSSVERVGDQIRVGRRGSLNGTLNIIGQQGHVAYPELAANAIHLALSKLDALIKMHWDNGNDQFIPTQLQISNIQAGTGMANVIPGSLEVAFNLRFNTEQTAEGIIQRIESHFDGLNCQWNWAISGQPFLTKAGVLSNAVCDAVHEELGYRPRISTSGGTSDGRFIAPKGVEVVELGLLSATIHQINECCKVSDLGHLSHIYEKIMRRLLTTPDNE